MANNILNGLDYFVLIIKSKISSVMFNCITHNEINLCMRGINFRAGKTSLQRNFWMDIEFVYPQVRLYYFK